MRALFLVLATAVACGRQLNPEFCAAHPTDDRCEAAGDANRDGASGNFDVAHLPAAVEGSLTSAAGIVIVDDTTINTTTGAITPPLPAGATILGSVGQDAGGNVMVIQAGSIQIDQTVTVLGDKPLIFVATRDIVVIGHIIARADGPNPGPGGALPDMGMGFGTDGGSGNNLSDSGGGGAGYGTQGGDGGDVDSENGAAAGKTYGTPDLLQGGSGGGRGEGPSACEAMAGAGGGAIQLSAGVAITISGGVDVGGGGGRGGMCSSQNDGGSGAGGGSGGMIYVQAKTLLGMGQLGANGGGGGGGASPQGATPGGNGNNGGYLGGGSGGSGGNGGGRGGDGANGTNPGMKGVSNTSSDQNGGGGGGGVGRIYYHSASAASYAASPPPTTVP